MYDTRKLPIQPESSTTSTALLEPLLYLLNIRPEVAMNQEHDAKFLLPAFSIHSCHSRFLLFAKIIVLKEGAQEYGFQ